MFTLTRTPIDLKGFRALVAQRIQTHPIVGHNAYCEWFSQGAIPLDELRRFTVQFSVFSHLFLEAQLRKCLNSPDPQSYHAAKEILLNELGVSFTREGSVENGMFRFRAAHFEWLVEFGRALGLDFEHLGKRHYATPSTLAFCDALMHWYGSDDTSTAAGASYAIEQWAAAGFWKQLISGLQRVRATRVPKLPLGFWTWHDQLEEQHAAHVDDELAGLVLRADFSEERFLEGGESILDAVAGFWEGLNEDRIALQACG